MTLLRINSHKIAIKQPLCLTIGNFDGVHFGHRQIILQLKETAKQHNLATGLLTFLPHPALFFRQKEKSSTTYRFKKSKMIPYYSILID